MPIILVLLAALAGGDQQCQDASGALNCNAALVTLPASTHVPIPAHELRHIAEIAPSSEPTKKADPVKPTKPTKQQPAEPARNPAPAAATKPIASALEEGWYVQVGAFSDMAAAELGASRADREDLSIMPTRRDGKDWFVLLLGPYSSREVADDVGTAYTEETGDDHWVRPSSDLEKIRVSALPRYPAANLHDDSYQPGSEWTLVWSDEFDGDSLDMQKWQRQVEKAGRFNKEWQRYTDSTENAYIDNGCLVIRAVHESDTHGHDQYTSARLFTHPEQGWQYGRIAARIQLPYGQGIWPAFWMLGSNIDEQGGDTPWPQSGEIDILELYGSKDDGVVEANIHYADESDKHMMMGAVAKKLPEGRFADNFHVFELEWDADSMQWFVDGERYASTSIAGSEFAEFHEKFFILLNIAVGGKAAGRPDDSTPFPQHMYVDWVRIYQRAST